MYETTMNALNAWSESLEALTANLKACVKQCRKDGTTGMSRANLRQIVSTRGVKVAPAQFDRLLDQAIDAAGVARFITR